MASFQVRSNANLKCDINLMKWDTLSHNVINMWNFKGMHPQDFQGAPTLGFGTP
jgi:hypothetical protein